MLMWPSMTTRPVQSTYQVLKAGQELGGLKGYPTRSKAPRRGGEARGRVWGSGAKTLLVHLHDLRKTNL